MSKYPYAEHDDGVVLDQPEPGKFTRRPMTASELAAREPALKIAKDIYRHANQAGVCYYEIWRLIADAFPPEAGGSEARELVERAIYGMDDYWATTAEGREWTKRAYAYLDLFGPQRSE